jgi:hypothetical protein
MRACLAAGLAAACLTAALVAAILPPPSSIQMPVETASDRPATHDADAPHPAIALPLPSNATSVPASSYSGRPAVE